jgi:SAM-dependent methyltransferase
MLRLRPPKPGTRFVVHHDQLALFHEAADEREYWGDYWLGGRAREHLLAAANGKLDAGFDVFWRLLTKYAAPGGRVLEGGSGPGHLVAALRSRGYAATGIDYVPAIVEFARATIPDLDVRVGDVQELPLEDESFDCYVSLGVVEHFEEGPERSIREGRRVTRKGGSAIFELPYLNTLRRSELDKQREHPDSADGLVFHQYYYDEDYFASALEDAGFVVRERIPNCWDAVLTREHPLVSRFWSSPVAVLPLRRRLRGVIRELPKFARRRYAHTMAFACHRID